MGVAGVKEKVRRTTFGVFFMKRNKSYIMQQTLEMQVERTSPKGRLKLRRLDRIKTDLGEVCPPVMVTQERTKWRENDLGENLLQGAERIHIIALEEISFSTSAN